MAKFIIEFEDTETGGMDSRIELSGFEGVTFENLKSCTTTQHMYLAIIAYINNELGLKIPHYLERAKK